MKYSNYIATTELLAKIMNAFIKTWKHIIDEPTSISKNNTQRTILRV